MTILGFTITRNPGSALARLGHQKRRQSIRETMDAMRAELGLPPIVRRR